MSEKVFDVVRLGNAILDLLVEVSEEEFSKFGLGKGGMHLIDEEVARLHASMLGGKLTELSEEQAEYLGVPVKGPFKSEHYRY